MDTYEMSLSLRNRMRYAKRVARKAMRMNLFTALLAPLFWMYAFVDEPRQWAKHCERMQKMLDE